MKVACIGAGPGGLFFATLLKRSRPGAEVVVFERNGPDDTFGFGVVFSAPPSTPSTQPTPSSARRWRSTAGTGTTSRSACTVHGSASAAWAWPLSYAGRC